MSVTAPSNSLLELALDQVPHFGQPELKEQRLTGARFSTELGWLADALAVREYGVPLVGLNRYSPEVDYYGDRYELYHAAILAQAAPPAPGEDATYEVVLGVADVLETGIQLRTVWQASPTPLFRLVEVSTGHTFELGALPYDVDVATTLGARAALFRRDARHVASAEAFASITFEAQGNFLHLTGSWAYNTPDAGTFFPMPSAHVLGFQIAFGPLEMSRPIVPVVATRAAEGAQR